MIVKGRIFSDIHFLVVHQKIFRCFPCSKTGKNNRAHLSSKAKKDHRIFYFFSRTGTRFIGQTSAAFMSPIAQAYLPRIVVGSSCSLMGSNPSEE